jgi:hypothetical protein
VQKSETEDNQPQQKPLQYLFLTLHVTAHIKAATRTDDGFHSRQST